MVFEGQYVTGSVGSVSSHMSMDMGTGLANFSILYGKKYIFDFQINENILSIDSVKPKLKNRLEV